MNNDPLINNLKILGILFFLVLFGFWKSSTDLKFMFLGKTTTAEITKVEIVKNTSRRGTSESLRVIYSFTDNKGEKCQGYSDQAIDWNPPPVKYVAIVYLPGAKATSLYTVSRLKSDSSFTGIIIFFAGVLGLLIWGKITYKALSSSVPND